VKYDEKELGRILSDIREIDNSMCVFDLKDERERERDLKEKKRKFSKIPNFDSISSVKMSTLVEGFTFVDRSLENCVSE
jgi:hypothetical protein